MRTWLSQGAKHLIFLKIEKNRRTFHKFYARFFINASFILSSACVFSRNRACVSVHSRPRPQHTIWIELSHRSIFEFLACDFPKTSYSYQLIPCFVYNIKALIPRDLLYTAYKPQELVLLHIQICTSHSPSPLYTTTHMPWFNMPKIYRSWRWRLLRWWRLENTVSWMRLLSREGIFFIEWQTIIS